MLVAVPAPGSDQDMSLWQAHKPMLIQALIPQALDERMLHGFPGLNQLELNTMLAGPLVGRLTGKFRPLVDSNRFRVNEHQRKALTITIPCGIAAFRNIDPAEGSDLVNPGVRRLLPGKPQESEG